MRLREATTALLRPLPDAPALVQVFDYLVDAVQRSAGPLARIPDPVISAAICHAGPADADAIGSLTCAQGRYQLAERAARHAYQIRAGDPAWGPDHPDTLAKLGSHALALRGLGQLAEAEAEFREVWEACTRVLGPDNLDTLYIRNNLAAVLRVLGRLEEAESEHRAVLDACIRTLSADHPLALASRNQLVTVLRMLGQLAETEAECRALLDNLYTGPGHRSPGYLSPSAATLRWYWPNRGSLDEAQAEYRAAQDALIRVLGTDHPGVIASRDNFITMLRHNHRGSRK